MPGEQLIGRDQVLATLRAGAESAAAGRGRLVLVTGEPGIGKTAVIAELARELDAAAALVLWGQCWAGDGAPAYWPWVQVLRGGMATGEDVGSAAVLLPEHAAAPAGPTTGSGTEGARFEVYDAVATFLRRLSERRRLLVVLDDLQWADEGSLRLLQFAARHLSTSNVLLVGGYREEDAGERLHELAADSDHLHLAPLDRDHVAALTASLTSTMPDTPTADAIWRRTGGNPLLVRELGRLDAVDGYRAWAPSLAPSGLLAAAGDILGRRLARLSQACAEMLKAAAVIGPEVRLAVLARLADDRELVPALLEEAVQARVLQPESVPVGTFRFTHDLFRETILADLSPRRRAQLHIRAGGALEALSDAGVAVHPAELAAHFAGAGGAVAAKTLRYSTLAAEQATASLAFDEARDHYQRALAALDLTADEAATDRLGLLLRLGEARNRAGDARAALEALTEAADQARSKGDPQGLAETAIAVHELGWRTTHGTSITLLEEAVGALAPDPSGLRARVLAALARELHHAVGDERDWDRAQLLAGQAVEEARLLNDPPTLSFCLLALHDVRWRRGTPEVRLPVIDAMAAASAEAGDPGMAAQARLLRATALIELGDATGAAELEEFCRQSEQLGHARARYAAVTRRATASVIAGELDRAQALASEGLALGLDIGEPDARGVYEACLWGAFLSGDRWHVPASGPDPRLLASEPLLVPPLREALTRNASGDHEGAGRALARLDLHDLPATHDLESTVLLAHVVAAAGTSAQRSAVRDMLAPYAGRHVVVGGCASYFGAVDHYLGLLVQSLGDPTQARAHFLTASRLHDRLGAARWAQRSRLEAEECGVRHDERGCMLRRSGDVWTIAFRGREAHLADSKGLRDLAVLLQCPGRAVQAVELVTGRPASTGADAVLDDRAKGEYRRRLAELDAEIDEAQSDHDLLRAERAADERAALIAELSAAVGLGGRDRRLGDESERARKAVTARIRDAIARVHRADPALGEHLSSAVRTGTWCSYDPAQPTRGQV